MLTLPPNFKGDEPDRRLPIRGLTTIQTIRVKHDLVQFDDSFISYACRKTRLHIDRQRKGGGVNFGRVVARGKFCLCES